MKLIILNFNGKCKVISVINLQPFVNSILPRKKPVSDFEYEFQMALMNSQLDNNIETLFLTTSAEYSFLSSSAVKQVAKFGGNIKGLVPNEMVSEVINKI